jgi:hypothetical protein
MYVFEFQLRIPSCPVNPVFLLRKNNKPTRHKCNTHIKGYIGKAMLSLPALNLFLESNPIASMELGYVRRRRGF